MISLEILDSETPFECLPQGDRVGRLLALLGEFPGRSAGQQRRRMLAALQRLGYLTTFEASRYLDCYSPTKRLSELRESGEEIETVMVWAKTEQGEAHRIGLYVLVSANDPAFSAEASKHDVADAADDQKETAGELPQHP